MMREFVVYDQVQGSSNVRFDLRHKETGDIIGCDFEIWDEFDLLEARRKAIRVLRREIRDLGHRWEDYEPPV